MTLHGLKLNASASLLYRKFIAPFERVHFADPKSISTYCKNLDKKMGIYNENWDDLSSDLLANSKFQDLLLHWKLGINISETSLINNMLTRIHQNSGEYKGLKSKNDVINYYEKFDQIYLCVKEKGLEIPPSMTFFNLDSFKMDGIAVDINYDGKLLFTGRGTHRLAMAQSASLEIIPIYVRKLHLESLQNRVWDKFLVKSK